MSLGKNDIGTREIFIDISSIRVAGSIRRAWDKIVPAHHSMRGVADDAQKWVIYVVDGLVFNCDKESSKLEALTFYFDDGTNSSAYEESSAPERPVTPDTVMNTEMQFICAWKPK